MFGVIILLKVEVDMINVIEVKNLTKRYRNKVAVNELDFVVESGSIFGLLGANGAGKSTAIECILGTKKKDGGQVRILGLDIEKNRKKIFSDVGVQFQDCAYQSLITVRELCEITACVYKNSQNYFELLKKFGLSVNLKTMVSKLSGGERQRLFIVLALIPNPKIVFLDELTTGLDTIARKEVWNYLLEMKRKGLTILLTSHYMDEVENMCDKILILKKGITVFYGTVEEAKIINKTSSFEEAYETFIKEEE